MSSIVEPDQVTVSQTSGMAVAAFFTGLLSVTCGFLAIVFEFDLLLLGVVLFWILALGFGIWSLREIKRAGSRLSGRSFANLGIGVAPAGFVLGFVLLPAT